MIVSRAWNRFKFPANGFAGLWHDSSVRAAVALFMALRLLTLLVAPIMARDVPDTRPPLLWFDPITGRGNPSGAVYEAALPPESPLAELTAPWRRYDTVWYIKIAMQGYRRDTGIVFPPLYPILIRAVVPFAGGNYVLAALLVANVGCVAALFLLHKLVRREFGDEALATRTLILLAAFPTAFYLVAGYTEPVFLALALGAFLATFDRRWWLAGGLALLAGLTRLQGIVLCLPLVWIAYVQYRPTGLRGVLTRLPVAAGAPLGTAIYEGYVLLNNLGSMEHAYNVGWKLTTRPPWDSILTFFQRWQAGIAPQHELNNAVILLLMTGLAVVVTLKLRPAYALYTWSSLLVILLRYHYGQNLEGAQFESAFRYVLLLFPCFIAGAMLLRRRLSLLIYLLLSVQWLLFLLDRFIHWRWVA
ncbi:MAG: hypothetical protein HZC41_07495 [Chloroflexi bacterium]|nr:hypothetical protein [Chloroflexota bacterium]